MKVSELTGTVLAGKYALHQPLGKGAFGTVYRAQELLDGSVVREVAIKLYSPLASAHDHVEGMLADCALPARILSSDAPLEVKRHFVQIYDFGYLDTAAGRCAFVAMELIRGAETLQNVMDRYRDVGLHPRSETVIDYATQFFTGLAAAHAAGVLHRDIKGGNVMVDAGVIRIVDFGVGARLDHDTAVRTTPSIQTPENFEGRHTVCSDVYQAGLMFYELYTGIAPFVNRGIAAYGPTDPLAERTKRATFRYRPGKDVPGVHYSELLDAVLAKCLAYSERARYPTAQAVLDALKQTDTVATAESALQSGAYATALRLAEQALANPDTDTAKRITSLRVAAAAQEAMGDLNRALELYRKAIALAESTGALFHNSEAFNALVDGVVLIYTQTGRAGMARLASRKRK